MDDKSLRDIEPAFGELSAFARATNNATRHVQALRDSAIFSDGEIPARQKALMAALWSVSARCEPCLKFYMIRARELGASEAEAAEVLAVAMAMGGCVGETWALKAFSACRDDGPADQGQECCT